MKVKNGKIIRTLTIRSLKASKLRNLVAIIAIALTAILFTTIFTIGGNMIASIQNDTMRKVGSSSHGALKYLTQSQYDNFKNSPLIKDISYSIIIGFTENDELKKKQTEIKYSEDENAKWGFSYPTVGAMPKEKMELVCSTITLDMLGIPHELGQSVPLEFSVHGKKYKEQFTLSGFWQGDDVMQATQIFFSREYTDSIVSIPKSVNLNDGAEAIVGTINADVWFNNSFDIEGKMEKLVAERGYSNDEIKTGVNWAYATSSVDITTLLMLVIVMLLILLSGYLIIYSIFTISVTGDIKFYGLLKTLGTTGKQLRRIVRGQALFLALIGIPFGLLIGYFLGNSLTPALMSVGTIDGDFKAPINPYIFIFSAIFSLITVFISCSKPGKIAAKVSPVEAVRYTDAPSPRKKKSKRTGKVTPFSMSYANVRRNPKKLAVIVVSLSLSMILLNSVYSMVNGFNMDIYLKDTIMSDFTVTDSSVYTAMVSDQNYEGVDNNFVKGVKELEGLENMDNIYFQDVISHKFSDTELQNFVKVMDYFATDNEHAIESIEQIKRTKTNVMHVYGIGEMVSKLIEDEQNIDFEKLKSGNYVLATSKVEDQRSEQPQLYNVGDKVTLKNENGAMREFEVLGVIDKYPYPLSCRHSHFYTGEIILAENVYLEFYGDKQPMMTIFNVADEHIKAADKWVSNYCKNINSDLLFHSRDYYISEFENMQNTFLILGGVLSFILALIGILNFLNAVVTSIFSRRRELAMLQSVGMTGSQLKSMLFGEGIAYAVLTIIFTTTIGTLISYIIVQAMTGQMWFFQWNFTLLPLLFTIPPLLIICAIVPLSCYSYMRKESVVDRLREV